MNTSESVVSRTDAANGIRGSTCLMANRIGPWVLAATVVGTNPGRRRWR